MNVTLEIPDDVAALIGRDGRNLPRTALEALAVEEYRAGRLSDAQFRRMLSIDRFEADAVLKAHGVFLDYTAADFQSEGETLRTASQDCE